MHVINLLLYYIAGRLCLHAMLLELIAGICDSESDLDMNTAVISAVIMDETKPGAQEEEDRADNEETVKTLIRFYSRMMPTLTNWVRMK